MAIKVNLTLSQVSQSITNNNSQVKATIKVSWDYGSWDATHRTSYLTIDGTRYTFENPTINPNRYSSGSQTLYAKTVTVGHNSDGSKTVSASASIVTGTSSGTVSDSTSKDLTTIPRATTPQIKNTSGAVISAADLGDVVRVSVENKASSSFTHDITYKFGTLTGTIYSGLSSWTNWTISKSLANAIKSATSGSMAITCRTKSGSTVIGTKTINLKLVIPNTAEFRPSISGISAAETVSGLAAKFGSFVQGKSKIKIITDRSGAYGSTVSNTSVKVDGKNYAGQTITTEAIGGYGNYTINVTVTDSRGRSVSDSIVVAVTRYYRPDIVSYTVVRCDASGNLDDAGDYAKVAYNVSIAPVGQKNDKSLLVQYKKKIDSGYSDIPIPLTAYAQSGSVVIPASQNYTYDFLLQLSDYFTATPADKILPTAYTQLDIHNSGRGVAIGKVAEYPDLFDVGMATRLRKGLSSDIPIPISSGGTGASERYVNAVNSISTAWNTSVFGNGNISINNFRLYQYLSMVYLRLNALTSGQLSAGAEYTLASVFKSASDLQANSSVRFPLATTCVKRLDAYAWFDSDYGATKITIVPRETIPANYRINLSGWYTV